MSLLRRTQRYGKIYPQSSKKRETLRGRENLLTRNHTLLSSEGVLAKHPLDRTNSSSRFARLCLPASGVGVECGDLKAFYMINSVWQLDEGCAEHASHKAVATCHRRVATRAIIETMLCIKFRNYIT